MEHVGKNLRNKYYGYGKLGMYTEIHDKRTIYIDNIYFSHSIGELTLEEWGSLPNGSVYKCNDCVDSSKDPEN